MKKQRLFYLIVLSIVMFKSSIFSQVDSNIIAFRNANLIPLDSQYVLSNYNVIISNGVIDAIGPSSTTIIPNDAYIIESNDKFIIPGLTDMHVHIWDIDYLLLFLYNGVTTIRNMWGESQHLAWRSMIRNGTILGPELYTTGPILEGNSVYSWSGSRKIGTVIQAKNIVSYCKSAGYDQIKIYNTILDEDVYNAIIDEAENQSIKVVGHPAFVKDSMMSILEYAYKTNIASLEHMEQYLNIVWNIPFDLNLPPMLWGDYYSEEIDSSQLKKLLDLQLQSTTWVCPTLTIYHNLITKDEYSEALQRPYLEYVKQEDLNGWNPNTNTFGMWPSEFLKEYRKNIANKKLVNAMHAAGVNLLIGTDCQNPFTIWGFSLHPELQLFVEAGLTPFETLQIATKNAAEFMDAEDEFGSIKEGLRADLILLNSNPLEDIKNAQDRVGVMVRGKWFEESVMKQLVDERFGITDIIEDEDIHINSDYNLKQNYPNPFNPNTTIKYQIPINVYPAERGEKRKTFTPQSAGRDVKLIVYDLLGRVVTTLVDQKQKPGNYEVEFDGSELTSGIYFYRLYIYPAESGAGQFVETKKMILLR